MAEKVTVDMLLAKTNEPDGGMGTWMAAWDREDPGAAQEWRTNEMLMLTYIEGLLERMFPDRRWGYVEKAETVRKIYRKAIYVTDRVAFLEELWRKHEIQKTK